MRKASEMNQVRVGIVGVVTVAVLWSVLLNWGRLQGAFEPTYSADFASAAMLHPGDDVRISGFRVGAVRSVRLEGDHIRVDFSLDHEVGSRTVATIKTQTMLGTKFLALTSAGAGTLRPGTVIPISRTDVPYDITRATSDLTDLQQRIDVRLVAQSLDALSRTFSTTPGALGPMLRGVSRISSVVAARDDSLHRVLASARSMTGVLAERNRNIVALVTDGNALMTMIEQRRQTLHDLLVGIETVTTQVSAFIRENHAQLRPALHQLNTTLDMLRRNQRALGQTAGLFAKYARALGEALAGGPYFYAFTQNSSPTNLAPMLPGLFRTQGQTQVPTVPLSQLPTLPHGPITLPGPNLGQHGSAPWSRAPSQTRGR